MPAFDTDILSDLVRRKHNCLLHLGELGERQIELIREGRMTELLDLLAHKQQMLVELQRIERGLDPFRGQDPERRPWRSPEARRLCSEQLARCEQILARIVRDEKQSEQEMVRRRDQTAAELQGIQTAGAARNAYQSTARNEVAQFDARL